MLRLSDPKKTHEVEILDTIFYLKSLTIAERQTALIKLAEIDFEKKGVDAFAELINLTAPLIEGIQGYENSSPKEVLSKLEFINDLQEIFKQITNFSTLSTTESKNSSSSLEQPTTALRGNAEIVVEPVKESVSKIEKNTKN